MADKEAYQSGIGSLLHMVLCVRSGIAAPVRKTTTFCSVSTAAHYAAMLNVIRYVDCTSDRGITYGHTDVPVQLWCDANVAACFDTRRSVSGRMDVCFGGAVSSWGTCQPRAQSAVPSARRVVRTRSS
jgi:hypothetical protein